MEKLSHVEAVNVFRALANSQRLDVMLALASNDEMELSLSELQAKLGAVSQSSLSSSVKQLRLARLVVVRRDGKWIRVRIASSDVVHHLFSLVNLGGPQS